MSRADTADHIARLIEERVPSGRAHVVGLSLGGSVAYELAARRPDLLDRVVIDGAGAVGTRLAVPLKVGVSLVSPLIRHSLVGRIIAKGVGLTDPAAIDDLVRQLQQADPSSFRRAFAQAQDVRITDALLRASCPTLLVAGEKELAVVRGSNRLLSELMPRAEARIMPRAGHGWLAVAPDVHIAMVRAWLTDRQLPAELVPERSARPRVRIAGSPSVRRVSGMFGRD